MIMKETMTHGRGRYRHKIEVWENFALFDFARFELG